MKKLILMTAAAMFVLVSCQKEIKNEVIPEKQNIKPASLMLDISMAEFQQIISSDLTSEKAPPWIEKIKKWIHSHTGNAQQWVDGQPICYGNGNCGPCPGICFNGGIIDDGGNGSQITEEEYALGLRAMCFSIYENSAKPSEKKLVIQIPNEYREDFIHNNCFEVENNELLPSFFVDQAGYNSIEVLAGTYPVINSVHEESCKTIVNISVK